jgi:hypothetical protein
MLVRVMATTVMVLVTHRVVIRATTTARAWLVARRVARRVVAVMALALALVLALVLVLVQVMEALEKAEEMKNADNGLTVNLTRG